MNQIPLGVGYYSRTEAARLLALSPSRVRRWVSGYTYWLKYAGTRTRRALDPVEGDLPVLDGTVVLSFVELMELRVVKAFLSAGHSLQRVRRAAASAKEIFGTDHPFVSRRMFTDARGRGIFVGLSQESRVPNVLELTGGNHLQIQSGELLEEYLDEVEFSKDTSLAHRWWPLSKRVPVVLDPRVCFGAPVIEGTRTRTDVIASMTRACSEYEAGEAYRLNDVQVSAALQFEDALLAA